MADLPVSTVYLLKRAELAIRVEKELVDGFATSEIEELNRLLSGLTEKAEAHSHHPKLRRLGKTGAKAKSARAESNRRGHRRAAARR